MINHISIGVNNTEHVANVLAEIWGGYAMPFPPSPNSWIVLADDGRGTAVEITPNNVVLKPGEGLPPVEDFDINFPTEEFEAKFVETDGNPNFVTTHLNINTTLSEAQIKSIAAREGWRCFKANRAEGEFQLIEVWIENRFMLEVMTPEMTKIYIDLMNPEKYAAWLNVPVPPKTVSANLEFNRVSLIVLSPAFSGNELCRLKAGLRAFVRIFKLCPIPFPVKFLRCGETFFIIVE